MGILNDIKAKIIELTSETTSTIYISELPNDESNVLALYSTSGFSPEYVVGRQLPIARNPTFQIILRNSSYATGFSKMESIRDALSGLTGVTINSTLYHSIYALGDIMSLGKNVHENSLFSINFVCKISQ